MKSSRRNERLNQFQVHIETLEDRALLSAVNIGFGDGSHVFNVGGYDLYQDNANFATTSSAFGFSEANMTKAQQVTTANGGLTTSKLNDAYDGFGSFGVTTTNGKSGEATYHDADGIVDITGNTITGDFNTQGSDGTSFGGLQLSQQNAIFALSPTEPITRFLLTIHNPTAAPITKQVGMFNNLGSDNNTKIVTSSSGDAVFTDGLDTWYTHFQNFTGANTTSSDPRQLTVVQGKGNVAVSTFTNGSIQDGNDNPGEYYTVTLNPGETKYVMLFNGLFASKAAAANAGNTVFANNASVQAAGLLAGIDPSTYANIVNWNLDSPTTLSITAPNITETNANQIATFNVTSSDPVPGGFDVAITTKVGTAQSSDYTLVTKTVHFAGLANEIQPVSVSITGDTAVEADETFSVSLGQVSGVSASERALIKTGATAVATIKNDDTETLSISAPTINETTADPRRANFPTSNQSVSFTVTSPVAVQGGFDVTISTKDGTAGSSDYSLVTKKIHFQGTAGEKQLVTVNIVGDSIVEDDETFQVILGAVSNTTATQAAAITTGAIANAVIIDDDTNKLYIEAPTITETNSDQIVTFTITSPNAVAGGFDIAITSQDGTAGSSDYVLTTTMVHFTGLANEKKTVSVTIKGDTLVEANETFKVILGAVSNTSAKQKASIITGAFATGTIINDD
jgi:hypothetical protein